MNLIRTKHPGIYRRGDRWVAVVSYRDGAGNNRKAWLTHRTQSAALDARRAFLNDLDRGIRPDGTKLTVAAFLEDLWLPYIEAERRPQTASAYGKIVRRYIVPAIGAVRLRDVDKDVLRRLYSSLPTTVLKRYCHRVLSSALGYAVKELDLIAANPCASIRPPKSDTPEAKHLDVPEARRMLREVSGHNLEGAVILGLVGGLRVGEACSIRWGDLDLDTSSLVVRGSYWGPTKSGKMRGLTLPTSALVALRRSRLAQAERLLAIGIRQDEDTFVTTDGLGQQMGPKALSGAFRRFAAERGFDLPRFHGLRHTCAVLMLVSGTDVKTAASRLGHANPALLFSTYSHFIESADQGAANKLDALLGRSGR
jgi:integrase